MSSTRDQSTKLPPQKDVDRLNMLLNQTRQQYQRELNDADYISFGDKLIAGLISVISFGLIQPANQQAEIDNKKRALHQKYSGLIAKIEKGIDQTNTDLQSLAALSQQFTTSIKHGTRADGYPTNWEEIIRAVRERDGYRCTQCGETSVVLHVHHVIPLSKGGSNSMSNLVTLCEKHHTAKHDHMRR